MIGALENEWDLEEQRSRGHTDGGGWGHPMRKGFGGGWGSGKTQTQGRLECQHCFYASKLLSQSTVVLQPHNRELGLNSGSQTLLAFRVIWKLFNIDSTGAWVLPVLR